MKYRTAFIRFSRRAICGVLLLTGLLAIGSLTPRRWNLPHTDCQTKPYRIYVAGEPMHVSLILPVKNSVHDWQQTLDIKQLGSDSQENYSYLKFGWGDRIQYMNPTGWGQMNALDVLTVLFKPGNASVLLVQGYDKIPAESGVEIKSVALSETEYLNLIKFLKTSFQSDSHGKPIRLQDGYSPTSGFYAATGDYSAWRTCNTWAAEGLDSANVATPVWSALAAPVMLHARQAQSCQ